MGSKADPGMEAGIRSTACRLLTLPYARLPWGFPGGSDGKESTCDAGDRDSIPGSGRSPGEGNGFPLQYSCLENSMDRGAWRAVVHAISESGTTK